jgi:hypothetical protein
VIFYVCFILLIGCSWTKNWLIFDNSYYKRIFDQTVHPSKTKDLLWLPTDQALVDDPEWFYYFKVYAENQDAFFHDYVHAHIKMSELGARYGVGQGRLRIPDEVIESTKRSNEIYVPLPAADSIPTDDTDAGFVDATGGGEPSMSDRKPRPAVGGAVASSAAGSVRGSGSAAAGARSVGRSGNSGSPSTTSMRRSGVVDRNVKA